MIGIIGAMEAEVALLKRYNGDRRGCRVCRYEFLPWEVKWQRGCCCKKRNRQSECSCLCAGARR